ncbi:Crp/Fnr family transcriptional regulator [Amycolatopsis anabasis]|uniref:Crp/Fnr family transcriptional regulator n=1 Tax=Amycolatopsis anabasis TaxID=1840409 RepID=UPI00131D448E|nr:Crp/Fnr family transcriptional regulator [Amycolatopsis anabasis]
MLALGTTTTYQARHTVIRQGAESHSVLVLLSGSVKVTVDSEFGRTALLAVRGPGDLLGEMAVLERRRRAANAVTCGAVRAKLIKGTHFLEFLDRNPDAWRLVARSLSERLRSANRRRAEFVACPAPVRVGRVLVEIVRRHGERTPAGWNLSVSLTQTEIATLAGVALGTLEKALQSMQRQGLVRRHYRRIVVEDMSGLCRFGGLPYRNPY